MFRSTSLKRWARFALQHLSARAPIAAINKSSCRPRFEALEDRTLPAPLLYLGMQDSGSQFHSYNIDTDTLTSITAPFSQYAYLDFAPNGTLYGLSGSSLYTINPATGAATFVATLKLGATTISGNGLTFKPDGTLYIKEYSDRTGSFAHQLHTANPSTGALTFVATISGLTSSLYGIEYGNGVLYGAYDNALYSISTSTGAATLIGTGTRAWDMDYGSDGVMRGTDPIFNRLSSINLANSNSTTIKTFSTKEPWGIASDPGVSLPTVQSQTPTAGSTITTSSVNIDVTFSKVVVGVDATDMVLTGTAASGASVGTPTNTSGNTWRFPVSGLISGALNISLAPDANDIEDATGNDLDPRPTTWSYTVSVLDFGDAPNSYATLVASNGARHNAIGPLLGTLRDVEADGQPTSTANGDDTEGNRDEDGVTIPALVPGANANITVFASAVARLDAFIDFNRDGDFADAGEKIFNNILLTAGSNNLAMTVPATAAVGATFARFRISTAGGLSFNGLANDGEVEDYTATIALPAPVMTAEPAVTAGTANTVAWSAVVGADSYYAEYDTDPNFGSPDGNSGWIAGLSHTFTGLTDAQTYHYRVKARQVTAGTTSSWTQTTQAEFATGTLSNVSTSSVPGDVVLTGGSGTEVTGIISNPGFETGSLSPWTQSGVGTLTAGVITTPEGSMPTEGTRFGRIFTQNNGSFLAGDSRSVSQSINLTGITEIRFDAGLTAPGGWQNRIRAEVRISGILVWSQTASGNFSNQSIDVSSFTGTHTLELRNIVIVSGTFGSHWFMFDNFRTFSSSGFAASGTLTSTTIAPSPIVKWGELTFNKTTPASTTLTADVLNSSNAVLATNVASGTNLDALGITQTSIKLRANLATSNSSVTPALHDWTVAWQQTADTVQESGVSNVVFSTQDDKRPIVSARTPTPGSTIYTSLFNLDVTFDEAVVGVDATDLVLSGAASASASVGAPTNIAGNTWRFPVSGLVSGPLNISLAPDANDIEDAAGNDLDPSPTTWSYTLALLDYGDAPDSYATLLASNGARHVATGPLLGSLRDTENDGQPFLAAPGDDTNGVDDEDGVIIPPMVQGIPAIITVIASAAARLDAFMDLNRDGDFADAGEKIFDNVPLAAGSNELSFVLSVSGLIGTNHARFRISTAGGLSFNGLANDGEVEDHFVNVRLAPPVMTAEPAATPGTSNTVAWSAVTDAQEYQAEYDTDPNFGSPDGNSGWIAGLSHTFTGLTDGQTYYYRARARRSAAPQSDPSNVVFSTQDVPPPNVTGQTPTAGATIASSSVNIDVTFSEVVVGIDATDLVLTGVAAPGAAVGAPSNTSGNTWRFPVSGLVSGALNVSLAPDMDDIEDAAGNDLNPRPTTWSYTVAIGPVVIDDGDPGYSESVPWVSYNLAGGFNGDYHYAHPSDSARTATWQTTGLPLGSYEVQATWVPFSNRATNAPFAIYDGTTLLQTVIVNQELTPSGGAIVSGKPFQILATVNITSGTLRVVLSNNANEYVIADAVRISGGTPPPPPVDLNWTGGSLTGPGTVGVGANFTLNRTYTVSGAAAGSNFTIGYYSSTDSTFGNGDDVLLGSETISAAGDKSVGSHSGDSPSLQINTAGSYRLFARLDNGNTLTESAENNNDKQAAQVLTVGTLPPVVLPQVIEDGDADYSESVPWDSYNLAGGYNGDYHYAHPSDSARTATWQLSNLPAGSYEVQATWIPFSNRATNAPFAIYDGTTLLQTVIVNQESTPSGGATVNGRPFQILATVAISSGTLRVVLSNNANEYVIADAVRISGGTPPPPPVDLNWTGGSLTGPGTVGVGANFTLNRTYTVSGAAAGSNFTIGYYSSTDSTFGNGDDVLLGTETISAAGDKSVGSHSGVSPSLQINSAGSYRLFARLDNGNALPESDENNNVTQAAQVLTVGPPPPVVIIDDGDADYSESVPWVSYNLAGGYNGDYHYAHPSDSARTATWQLSNLPAGSYEVQATWIPFSNRATNAPFAIYDGTTLLQTVIVNQELPPSGGAIVSGKPFQILATVNITSGTLRVVLSNNANEYVIADAVRIAPVGAGGAAFVLQEGSFGEDLTPLVEPSADANDRSFTLDNPSEPTTDDPFPTSLAVRSAALDRISTDLALVLGQEEGKRRVPIPDAIVADLLTRALDGFANKSI